MTTLLMILCCLVPLLELITESGKGLNDVRFQVVQVNFWISVLEILNLYAILYFSAGKLEIATNLTLDDTKAWDRNQII